MKCVSVDTQFGIIIIIIIMNCVSTDTQFGIIIIMLVVLKIKC